MTRRSTRLALAVLVASTALAGCLDTNDLQCKGDTKRCGDTCAAFKRDEKNCGDCGIACAAGQACTNGVCGCPVTLGPDGGQVLPGQTTCQGACTDTRSDPQNCGACGNACGLGQICQQLDAGVAACVTGVCPFPTCGDGSCRNLDGDPQNCGACGNVCASGSTCTAGQCAPSVVAACIEATGGKLVPFRDTVAGPVLGADVQPTGTSFADALGVVGRTLLFADDSSSALFELPFSRLGTPSPEKLPIAASRAGTSQLLSERTDAGVRLYAMASSANSLVIYDGPPSALSRIDPADGGPVGALGLTAVGGTSFGPGTFPEPLAKVGNVAYVPLNGTGLVRLVDVSSPTAVADAGVIDLNPLAAPGYQPSPTQALLHNGKVYVAANDLRYEMNGSVSYGPPLLVRIDPSTTPPTTTTVLLDANECQNVEWLATVPASVGADLLLVSCAGARTYDPSTFAVTSVTHSALVVLQPNDQRLTAWVPPAPTGNAVPVSVGRAVVLGSRIYVADEAAQRLFTLDLTANQLLARAQAQPDGGTAPQVCGAYISDLAVVPAP